MVVFVNKRRRASVTEELVLEVSTKALKTDALVGSEHTHHQRVLPHARDVFEIFNGLRKAGLLSVRKQGRTRLFKLSRAASLELEMT